MCRWGVRIDTDSHSDPNAEGKESRKPTRRRCGPSGVGPHTSIDPRVRRRRRCHPARGRMLPPAPPESLEGLGTHAPARPGREEQWPISTRRTGPTSAWRELQRAQTGGSYSRAGAAARLARGRAGSGGRVRQPRTVSSGSPKSHAAACVPGAIQATPGAGAAVRGTRGGAFCFIRGFSRRVPHAAARGASEGQWAAVPVEARSPPSPRANRAAERHVPRRPSLTLAATRREAESPTPGPHGATFPRHADSDNSTRPFSAQTPCSGPGASYCMAASQPRPGWRTCFAAGPVPSAPPARMPPTERKPWAVHADSATG